MSDTEFLKVSAEAAEALELLMRREGEALELCEMIRCWGKTASISEIDYRRAKEIYKGIRGAKK